MAGNPFRYGDVATGEYFTDRDQELDEVIADVSSGQNIVIISPRRYGKTSLMFEAMRRLREQKVLIAYLDLFRAPTKDRFADLLASAVFSGLINPVERVLKDAVSFFQRLPIQPRVTVDHNGMPTFEFSAGQRSRDIDQTIEGLLALPGRIAAERRRAVAIVFDEFQEVVSIDPHLPGIMRAVFQTQGDVSHIFLGSKRHLMQEVFTGQNQPLYKMAKPISLKPIQRGAFSSFIRARFADTGLAIDEVAMQRVLTVTGGHPHDTQELCYFLWSLTQGGHPPAATGEAVVDAALAQVLDAESAHYTTLWEGLAAHQRLVLLALAAELGAVFSESYRRDHRLGPASSVQRSLTRLVDRELIEQDAAGVYVVADVFFREWITARAG
jgi:AAA+ ATPase superfamily predicted ATPase